MKACVAALGLLSLVVVHMAMSLASAEMQQAVTASDVTGTWSGPLTQVRGPRSPAELTLQQTGPNVTGWMSVRVYPVSFRDAPVQGTINGDVVRLSGAGVDLELVVKGDRMSGSWSEGARLGKLELSRSPERSQ
jgi:hypothetical protein